MVCDCFPFFNELDLLEIRLNVLDPFVDCFVLSESPLTFSGKPKPLYYQENRQRFKKWQDKIINLVTTEDSEVEDWLLKYYDLAPLPHYQRAFRQKEYLRLALKECREDDIIYYGDVDEIWKPQVVDDRTYKLRQLNYSYYLNQRSSEEWIGTFVTRYGNIKTHSINYLRAKPKHFLDDGGWHFTNMGGPKAVKAKLKAYDHQEFNTTENLSQIKSRIANGEDILGRLVDWQGKPFQYWLEETNWPDYLKKSRKQYAHLLK